MRAARHAPSPACRWPVTRDACARSDRCAKRTQPASREGSLDAPTRHPLDWKNPEFYDQAALDTELERVFNICHGCRRCVSLCHAFPTLFDLVDESATMEVDGVAKSDYAKVVEQCYLCDLCYQTKCPYVPPHPWNVDFPHLMLRAKAARINAARRSFGAKILSDTTRSASSRRSRSSSTSVNAREPHEAGAQAAGQDARRASAMRACRRIDAHTARRRLKHLDDERRRARRPAARAARSRCSPPATATASQPQSVEDLAAVLRHNGIAVKLVEREVCCGMPKLELGDLEASRNTRRRIFRCSPPRCATAGTSRAAIPSCVLMFKQELPLMFPDDEDVQLVQARTSSIRSNTSGSGTRPAC